MNYLVKLRRCFQILGSLPIWKAEADEKAIRIERQNEQLLMQTGEQSRSFAQLAENVAQLQTCQQKQNARQEQLAAQIHVCHHITCRDIGSFLNRVGFEMTEGWPLSGVEQL